MLCLEVATFLWKSRLEMGERVLMSETALAEAMHSSLLIISLLKDFDWLTLLPFFLMTVVDLLFYY